MARTESRDTLGWKEWLALPELGIQAVKAKVDTGARTSALHAFKIEPFSESGTACVRFWFHPARKRTDLEIVCESPVLDQRNVRDSGGHQEERFVIKTPAQLGDYEWPIEITLTSREDMLFRMLLGREALIDGNFHVDPSTAYLSGKKLRRVHSNYIKGISR